jgi:hypothetical protein
MFNKITTNTITFIHECNLCGVYTWSYLISATRARHIRLGVSARTLTYKNILLVKWGWTTSSHWSNPVNAPPLLNT